MIYGIGTDICDIRRIRSSFEKYDERFVQKIFSHAEFTTWQERHARHPERALRYLATRFSAKEAFSKAIGLGMRLPMTWRHCEIAKQSSGEPFLILHGELKTWFEAKNLQAFISLSDESDYAAAFCVVETQGMIPAYPDSAKMNIPT